MTSTSPNLLRLEALRLYREALRVARSRSFSFPAPSAPGKPISLTSWGSVLQKSLRSEFESNRLENDPAKINRLLAVGFDSLNEMMKKLYDAERKLKEGANQVASKGLIGTPGTGSTMNTISSNPSQSSPPSTSNSSSSSSPSNPIQLTTTTTVGGIPILGALQLLGEKKWLAAEAERKARGIVSRPSRS